MFHLRLARHLASKTQPFRPRPLATCTIAKLHSLLPSHRLFSSTSSAPMEKILSSKACPPAGPYTQAIKVANTIYVSGQIPADDKGNLIEGSIAEKTRCCAQNIKAILEEAGSSLDKIIKCTVFLDDMANFAEMNGEYEKHFAHKPARSCVAVKQLPKGVPVEIECIALV